MSIGDLRQQANLILQELQEAGNAVAHGVMTAESILSDIMVIGISGSTSTHIPEALEFVRQADEKMRIAIGALYAAQLEITEYRDKL